MLEPAEIVVGGELAGPNRYVSPERVRWYGDGMFTAAAGEQRATGVNIHTDEAFAKAQGLPTAIADGMMSTNWISSMLTVAFGAAYLERGELRTKYIRPVPVGIVARTRGRITAVDSTHDGACTIVMQVWIEDESEELLTEGDAVIRGVSRIG